MPAGRARPDSRPVTVAVVGGGVAGIAAAGEVRRLRPEARILLFEAADRLGGKVRVSEVGGLPVDEGADALLRRVPEGLALAGAAGLSGDLVSPATGEAAVLVGGRLRPLPGGTLLGVPGDLRALARSGVISRPALLRAACDLLLPGATAGEDVSVGELVTRRLGRQVTDRLVDPLLGGVYAGRADLLSLQATLPALTAAAGSTPSLVRAAGAARQAAPPGPVFASLRGGLGRLPAAAAAASGAEVRLGTVVRGLTRIGTRWRVDGSAPEGHSATDVDAVVLAVPAAPASRLLATVAPLAAAELARIEYASVAVVTVVLDGPTPGRGSGYLVPAAEGRIVKAVTFTSRKWAHLPGDRAVVRASIGRYGDVEDLQRDDADLVAAVLREVGGVVGPLGRLVDSRVTRWGGALPQYRVGHRDLVARALRAVAGCPGLAIAGAYLDGVGVPACIRGGEQAARAALTGLMMEP